MGYCNEGIDAAEEEILTLYEDYFLKDTTISLVQGTSLYSLPSDIYADKIRGVIYRNGAIVYEVFPYRKLKKFLQIEMTKAYGSADDYQYFIKTSDAVTGYQLVLLPPARETSTNITLYYIRNATRVPLSSEGSQAASLATVTDIPEFTNFVTQFMKVRIFEKEQDARHDDALQKLQYERQQMTSTLSKMIVDDNDTIDMDMSFYKEHS